MAYQANEKTFETTSRKLEQFLYMHDIHHCDWRKDPYGTTIWVYPNTPEVQRVVTEYMGIVARRKERWRGNPFCTTP